MLEDIVVVVVVRIVVVVIVVVLEVVIVVEIVVAVVIVIVINSVVVSTFSGCGPPFPISTPNPIPVPRITKAAITRQIRILRKEIFLNQVGKPL